MDPTQDDSEEYNPSDLYDLHEVKTPRASSWAALVHCYSVAILGTIGNALASWCVETCTKTRRPVKVSSFGVFVPSSVICSVTRPVDGEELSSNIKHQPHRVSKLVSNINTVVYSILAQTELASMTAVATVRASSVWAPQRPRSGSRGAAVSVFALFMYSTFTGSGSVGSMSSGESNKPWAVTLVSALYFINTTMPALITGGAYILIIYAIHRNKRRSAARQHHPQGATSMDQATKAISAVFISNLIFGLPHSIYHLMVRQPYYMHVIFHVIFSTHFVVDPSAFVWLNTGYRRHFFSSVKNVTKNISHPTSSFHKAGSASRSDHHHLQSSTHKQESLGTSHHAAETIET